MTIRGADLSFNQVPTDLSLAGLRPALRFVFARATIGYLMDYSYPVYRRVARAAGIAFGSYHALLRHNPPNDSDTHPPMQFDPVQQARSFAAMLDGRDDLPAVVDVEASDVTDDELWAFLMEFKRLRPRTEIILYTSQSAWYRCVGRGKTRYKIFRLWLADYNGPLDFPDLWTVALFHQSSGTGHLDGYNKPLDLDEFLGSETDWDALLEEILMTTKNDKQAMLDQVNAVITASGTVLAQANSLRTQIASLTTDGDNPNWWESWPEDTNYEPLKNLGVAPAAVVMRDAAGVPLAGIKPRTNTMQAMRRHGYLFLVAHLNNVDWWADARELLAQPQG